jgi:hypothetical protein
VTHLHYHPVEDLPGLRPCGLLEPIDPGRIVDAVASLEAPGRRLEEKVDGCWCALSIGDDGRLAAISRAGLPLRQAGEWRGRLLGRDWAGWTIVGEVLAGTPAARAARDADPDGEAYPRVYATHAYYRGEDRSAMLAAVLAELPAVAPWARIAPMPACPPWESWRSWSTRVLGRGAEGLIVVDGDRRWRVKPLDDVDRVVLGVRDELRRDGRPVAKVALGVAVRGGRRPRYRETQVVLLPRGAVAAQIVGRVVRVAGASVDPDSGVVRHARIAGLRSDKIPSECRA